MIHCHDTTKYSSCFIIFINTSILILPAQHPVCRSQQLGHQSLIFFKNVAMTLQSKKHSMHSKSQISDSSGTFFIGKMLLLFHQSLKHGIIYLIADHKGIRPSNPVCFYIICTFLCKFRKIPSADSLSRFFIISCPGNFTRIYYFFGFFFYNTEFF